MAVQSSTLSKAGQMRLKRAQGMSVSQIAKLFDVTYHNAYSVVVTNRHRNSRILDGAGRLVYPRGARRTQQPDRATTSISTPTTTALAPIPFSLVAMSPEELAKVDEATLFAAWAKAKTKAERANRRVATEELDRRDPTGEWLDKAAEWEQAAS